MNTLRRTIRKQKEDGMSKNKKREDLTLENWSNDLKDNMDIVWSHRIKAEVIDSPPIVRMTEPPMTDPVMNMLCYMMTGKSLDELEKDG